MIEAITKIKEVPPPVLAKEEDLLEIVDDEEDFNYEDDDFEDYDEDFEDDDDMEDDDEDKEEEEEESESEDEPVNEKKMDSGNYDMGLTSQSMRRKR